MITINDKQKKDIGLQFVLDKLSPCSPFGAERLKKLRPYTREEINLLLNEQANLKKLLENYESIKNHILNLNHKLGQFKDIQRSIKKLEHACLDEVELFEIKNFLLLLSEILPIFGAINEKTKFIDISLTDMTKTLDILDPDKNRVMTFYISEKYSKALREIRAAKKEIEEKIALCSSAEEKKELLNERLQICCSEEDEEAKTCKKLTKRLKGYSLEFSENIRNIGILDLLIQKVLLAIEYKSICPSLSLEEKIVFKNLTNPQIREFMPISITLEHGTSILTGANMGGKSVALRTLVLNILLAQMGFYVFAEQAELPIFDSLHFISEDLQSIDRGLSTFAAEMIEFQDILSKAQNGFAFIALDEFARGTNPQEGAVIVKSVGKRLQNMRCISILTTHYDNAVDESFTHYQVVGLRNMDLAAKNTDPLKAISNHMDYSLIKVNHTTGVPKDALNICRLISIDNELLNFIENCMKNL